jgi:N-acetyl-S-(2-succino)cysteine monooxygenase
MAGRAKLDAVLVSDAMGLEDIKRTNPWLIELEPITLISALAAVTTRIGLVATVSTTLTHHDRHYRRHLEL